MFEYIRNEWEDVKSSYEKLGDLKSVKGGWQSEGEIEIIDSERVLWKTFSVKIYIPLNYPVTLPSISETGNAIPKEEEDWHVNHDGSCCVGPNTKIYRKLNYDISLKRWLDIVVLPYLFDQVHKLEKGFYIGKEHSHGKNGLVNDYKEWWELDSEDEVVNKLGLIIKKVKFPRNSPCFCGSNNKYKRCHLFAKTFNNIPIEIFKDDLAMILSESATTHKTNRLKAPSR